MCVKFILTQIVRTYTFFTCPFRVPRVGSDKNPRQIPTEIVNSDLRSKCRLPNNHCYGS